MPNDIANNMADTIHWLEKELKEMREENKVLMQECDRLIKEKGEFLSKVSGGDVLRICQLEEQLKNWKEEYANLNKISYGYYKELKEAKELLRLAVKQMAEVGDICDCIHSQNCPLDECGKFTFHDEIMKFINN